MRALMIAAVAAASCALSDAKSKRSRLRQAVMDSEFPVCSDFRSGIIPEEVSEGCWSECGARCNERLIHPQYLEDWRFREDPSVKMKCVTMRKRTAYHVLCVPYFAEGEGAAVDVQAQNAALAAQLEGEGMESGETALAGNAAGFGAGGNFDAAGTGNFNGRGGPQPRFESGLSTTSVIGISVLVFAVVVALLAALYFLLAKT